jgi:hypothetical protein
MTDSLYPIMVFQADRRLHEAEFDWLTEATNVMEELFEALGYQEIDKVALREEIVIFERLLKKKGAIRKHRKPTEEDVVDAFGDIIVFATGAIMKAGHDPRLVMSEIGREINSRKQDPEQELEWRESGPKGKWQKWKEQPKDTLYKADFSITRLVEFGDDSQ